MLLLLTALAAGAASPATAPGDATESKDVEEVLERVQASSLDTLQSSNLVRQRLQPKADAKLRDYPHEIDAARILRRERDNAAASKLLLGLLDERLPSEHRRTVMLELAMVAQDENQLGRAQQILAHYLHLFPTGPSVPEVLLRQGLLYRKMGANGMAVTKFYAVLNSALSMQVDQFDYYKRLVLQAQTEIADTYYQQGKYQEAIECYRRILKQSSAELNKSLIHFKLIRCLTSLNRHGEAVPECEAFFAAYPQAPEAPELRLVCADSLRQLGRRRDSMLQVLELLESQKGTVKSNPEGWTYWQQKAGNQIANELYKDGDYLNALEIYNRMSVLNTNVSWQVPIHYQAGLIYDHLQQPAKALEQFEKIIAREKEIAVATDSPSLPTVLEMAKWRKQNMGWQSRTEVAVLSLKLPTLLSSTNRPTPPVPPRNTP